MLEAVFFQDCVSEQDTDEEDAVGGAVTTVLIVLFVGVFEDEVFGGIVL